MGEDTNQIEREIRNKREHLGRNLDELGDRARELADWRTHYQNHAGPFLGVAFAAGAVLAMSVVPRRSDDRGFSDRDTSHDPYRPRLAAAPSPRNGTFARAMREADDTWGQIADALLRAASAKAIQVVSELVPAVREHLDPQPRSTGSRALSLTCQDIWLVSAGGAVLVYTSIALALRRLFAWRRRPVTTSKSAAA